MNSHFHADGSFANKHTDPLRFCMPPETAVTRHAAIAQNAYFRAQQRGFEPGHELEDWLAAEEETDTDGTDHPG